MVDKPNIMKLKAGEDVEIVRKLGQAESIAELYTGQKIEILLEGSVGRRQYADFEHDEMVIVMGTVLGASGDMLRLMADYNTSAGSKSTEILLNGWMIKAVTPQTSADESLQFIFNLQKRLPIKR